MGSCAAPSAKGDDKFITTDYLQQCPIKDAGSRTCIEKVAPFDRKPFDGQTGAKSSAREIR
ncbi:hypothetical protein ACJEJS_25750, partial [Escherichia coli]